MLRPLWLAGAAVLAAFLFLRRRKLEPALLVGGLIAVAGALLYGLGLFELPNLERLLEDLGRSLGTWTYLLVGGLAFLETGAFVGLLAPGETTILVGGVVAGQGEIDIVALIALVWACAVAGDLVSFYLGRRLGREFLETHGAKVSITPDRLEKVEGFFDKHGGKAILLGRFVGLVRAIAPFLAGRAGCRCGASCPTTSSARGCGARRSACSASCSGGASEPFWTTRRPGRSRWAPRSSWWPGSWRSCGSSASPPTGPAPVRGFPRRNAGR